MKFHPFEVSIPHIIYAALGGFVVFFGMFSLFIRERLYIGEACWAFLFGVIIGPYCANIFDPRSWGHGDRETTNTIVLEVTRVVLAIGVFAIGVELPKAYMARHWRSLLFLLAPVMTWGWFVSGALIYALIPGLTFLSSLAVAACLTPTDPILAAAVVGGKYADKHVPAHLRHLLAAESGCNDGAAYPFLWIALYLTIDKTTGQAISDWFLLLWLYQVILAIVFGACLGFGFRHLMKFCERNDLIDRQSYVAQYISLAMLTIGSCTLLGTDDLLAAFSCGTAFAWDGFFNRQTEEAVFSSVIDLLFNIAAFVFVGAWIPFSSFADATLSLSVWRLIVIAILVMLLRRLPVMVALYKWIPDVKTLREAFFSGHFGPMGVGAVFISTLAAEQLPAPSNPPANQQELLAATIQPIVAFMVLCSILIHGLSIPFFSLGRRVHTVSRTWSRHDTFGRTRGMPEWANLTRPMVRGEEIVINRDADLERGELTVHGEETPTEKGSTTQQDEEATRSSGEDMREQNPPDGREIVAEWKEGLHKIVERRNGPGEEVEVEVHRNHYAPGDTAIHRMTTATEDAAHSAVNEIRDRLSRRFSPTHGPTKAMGDAAAAISDTVHRDEEHVQKIIEGAEQKAKEMIHPPENPHPTQSLQDEGPGSSTTSGSHEGENEDEGWVSDGEDQSETSMQGRAKSKSPKIKSPKLAVLRPAGATRRRQSIRRGMLGVRMLGRPPQPDDHPRPTPEPATPDSATPVSPPTPDEMGEESPQRGRYPTSLGSSISTPKSQYPHSRIRHARIDSLRSIDSRTRRSLREASPARSVRWADEPETEYAHGHSGASTPRIISPSTPATPLPGSEGGSDDEQEERGRESGRQNSSDSQGSGTQVRFSLPDTPPHSTGLH